jgi:hypothetical protein
MADLDRITGREPTEPALIVWNGDTIITVQPDEFSRMRQIIEKEGENNFSDDSDGSFSFFINLVRQGEDEPFDNEFTVAEFALHLEDRDKEGD